MKTGPMVCHETSGSNYHYSQPISPEESTSHLLGHRSFKLPATAVWSELVMERATGYKKLHSIRQKSSYIGSLQSSLLGKNLNLRRMKREDDKAKLYYEQLYTRVGILILATPR